MSKGMRFASFLTGGVLIAISLIFTVNLFLSMAPNNQFMKIIFAATGVCIDIGKIISCGVGIYSIQKGKQGTAALALAFYLGCFSISMMASQGLDLNEANQIKNKATQSSDYYQNNLKNTDKYTESQAEAQAQAEVLSNNIDSKVTASSAQLRAQLQSALDKNWLTTPPGSPREGADVIREKIASLEASTRSQLQAEIDSLNATVKKSEKLSTIASQNVQNASSTGLTTDGLISFSEWAFGTSFGQWLATSPDDLLGKIYVIKNFFCEFLGMFLFFVAKKEEDDYDYSDVSQLPDYNFEPEPKVGMLDKIKGLTSNKSKQVETSCEDDEKADISPEQLNSDLNELNKEESKHDSAKQDKPAAKNRIGFTPNGTEPEQTNVIDSYWQNEETHLLFTEQELIKYTLSMEDTRDGNICASYVDISKQAGIPQATGNIIRKFLLKTGKISCAGQGRKTLIND